ncbi:hypothetical protein [Luedemannella helvata]|uniref:hypothetical protein n=1 Tax=Luedemannella helvata TaxID=349315 RepID=UPI0031D94E39
MKQLIFARKVEGACPPQYTVTVAVPGVLTVQGPIEACAGVATSRLAAMPAMASRETLRAIRNIQNPFGNDFENRKFAALSAEEFDARLCHARNHHVK